MFLYIYVAKTHLPVLPKALWFGHIYKCVKAQYAEMCLFI